MASIRTRKTSHGKSFQVRHAGHSRTFSVREDAKRYALELERRDALGTLYQAPSESFGAFLDSFIDRKRLNGAKPRTIEANKEQAHYLESLRHLPVSSLKAAEVEDMVAGIPAKASAGKALALLKSSLKAARRRGHRIDEAILELEPPRYESREVTWLTLPQVYELSSWMPDYIKHIVPFAALTGMRQGELFDLLDSDLDLEAGTLQVQRGKTKAARRTVTLSGEATRLLKAQLLARAPQTSLVFPTKTGIRWEKSRFMGRYFRPASVAAGFGTLEDGHYEGLVFHHLRHTFVSLAAQAGVTQEVIEKLAGWKPGSAKQMYARYRHVYDAEKVAAVAMLDAMVEAR